MRPTRERPLTPRTETGGSASAAGGRSQFRGAAGNGMAVVALGPAGTRRSSSPNVWAISGNVANVSRRHTANTLRPRWRISFSFVLDGERQYARIQPSAL